MHKLTEWITGGGATTGATSGLGDASPRVGLCSWVAGGGATTGACGGLVETSSRLGVWSARTGVNMAVGAVSICVGMGIGTEADTGR